MKYYLLRGPEAIPTDLMTWARSFEASARKVDHTVLKNVFISTVFLGLDHNLFEEGPPLIFETMVFKNKVKRIRLGNFDVPGHDDLEQERYSTWDEAVAGHKRWVRIYKRKENLKLVKK